MSCVNVPFGRRRKFKFKSWAPKQDEEKGLRQYFQFQVLPALLSTKRTPIPTIDPSRQPVQDLTQKRTQEPNDQLLFTECSLTFCRYQCLSHPLKKPPCLPGHSLIHSWDSPSLRGTFSIPTPIVKSQLTQRVETISALKGAAGTRDRENRGWGELRPLIYKEAELEIPCLCLASCALCSCMVSWIFFHFRWSESKKQNELSDQAFLLSANPFALLLPNMGWSFSVENFSLVNNPPLPVLAMTDQPAALGLNGLKTFDAWWSSPTAFKSPHQSGFFLRAGPPRRGQSGLMWSEQPVHTILAGCVKHDLRKHRINNPGSVPLTGATYYITLGKSVHHFRYWFSGLSNEMSGKNS